MLKGNAYRLAAQTRQHLRRSKTTCALWIVNGDVHRTKNTALDIEQMERKGAVLVGVFDGEMPPMDMAEAIITADAENDAARRKLTHLWPR